jgi:hypothetical protein
MKTIIGANIAYTQTEKKLNRRIKTSNKRLNKAELSLCSLDSLKQRVGLIRKSATYVDELPQAKFKLKPKRITKSFVI